MKARVVAVVAGLGLAAGVLAAVWVLALGGSSTPRQVHRSVAPAEKTYAQLVAANYRVLSAKQSSRLLRFADAYAACMREKGVALGQPQPHATKIMMALPHGLAAMTVVRQSVACAGPLGGPPKDASLVQPKGGKAIELYLPKRCLLDRKVATPRTTQ